MLCLMATLPMQAADYTTLLTQTRGFTEVTNASALVASPDYYYILASAEDTGLLVGIGGYELKPGWASEQTKALRYVAADAAAVMTPANFFTIEKSGSYIGLRNVVYSADLFQTHDGAGYMYVNTFTDKNLDEWSWLTPTCGEDGWTFESGKYPLAGGDEFAGFLGPWNNSVAAGEALALNRKNTAGDEAGRFRLFRIAKSDYVSMFKAEKTDELRKASPEKPVDATWLVVNPSFETGDMTGWTFSAYNTDEGLDELKVCDYGLTLKEGGYVLNGYQWWCPTLSASQTVTGVPCGEYELSAVLCTWEGREVTLSANGASVTKTGVNDATGLAVTIPVMVGSDGQLMITAGSHGEWWNGGHEGETQTFFKIDDLRLTCKRLFKDEELGTFTAAALNVDGLPTLINNDGPGASGTKLISTYLNRKGYDFVGISEDFEYHSDLTSNMTGYSWGTHRGSVNVTNLLIPANTDGLELAWNKNTVGATNESWTQWEHSESGDGNQYIKKGFRHYDMTVDGGEVIDVYVLHMDAGDVPQSRERQWAQLAGAVNAADGSRPKLIIGDTNSRWTREDIMTNFVNQLNGFSVGDPWVKFWRGDVYPTTSMADLTDGSDPANFSNYEVVDKILYVNPTAADALQLMPKSFRIEQDYTYGYVEGSDNTKWLGDHRPVVVDFALVRLSELTVLKGDVNRDGTITIADVTALVNIILGADAQAPYVYDHEAADVNGDGTTTIADVTALVNVILGKGN